MSTQGTKREVKEGYDKKFVGFSSVQVKAISPTRKELNALLGTEESDNTDEINYLDQDKEGNDRVRVSYWLYDETNKKYFVHTVWLCNKKPVLSKDGLKTQFVNSACESLYWPDKDSLPENFTNFTSKDKSEVFGSKTVRESLKGEGDLCSFARSWLGRLNFYKPDAVHIPDTKALLKGDFKDIRSDIEGGYDSPFVILVGVETDVTDPTKQYQKVYGAFLQNSMMEFIKNPSKLKSSDYAKGIWDKFEIKVKGEHGFRAYYELVPLTEYNPDNDVSQSETTRKEKASKEVTSTNSKY